MKNILILLTVVLISIPAFGQHDFASESETTPDMEELFSVKETFRYEVKYGFLRLGWVNVRLLSDSLYQDQDRKHLLTEIESNPSIPFVGKNWIVFIACFM